MKVPVSAGRTHSVHVISRGKDDAGQQLVEFQAVCGKAKPEFESDLLRKGGRLEVGGYAIRRVGQTDYFVLQHRVRLVDVSQNTLTHIIPYLAEQADAVKSEVHPGG